MDIFDELESRMMKASQGPRLPSLSGVKSTISDAYSRLSETPGNVSTIREGLRNIGIQSDPIDRWDVESSLRSAKDRLVGLWRGYVVPALR